MNDETETIPYGWLVSLADSPLLKSSQFSFKKATGHDFFLKAASPACDELPPEFPFLLKLRAPVRVAGTIVAYLTVDAGRLDDGDKDAAFLPIANAMLESNCSAFELGKAYNVFSHAPRITPSDAECLLRTLQRYAFVIGDQAPGAVAQSHFTSEEPAPASSSLSACCA